MLDSITPSVNLDFGLICNSNFDIKAESFRTSGWVFPGQQHSLNISGGDISKIHGISCAQGQSGIIRVDVSSLANYIGIVSGSLTPNSFSNNIFEYNVSDFSNLDFSNDIGIVFETDTTAQMGDSICVSVKYEVFGMELDTTNNRLEFCYPVINSYDPNNKVVFPTEIEYQKGEWVYYVINFQNTGTAPAFNIRITDTLSDLLDLETFQMLSSSHKYTNIINKGVATFFLNNIMLVDSNTNQQESKGYIQFKIRAKKDVSLGTIIYNKVHIYFDYNSPITTNSANCKVSKLTKVANVTSVENLLEVYPNPTKSLINIRGSSILELRIYDISSRLIETIKKPFNVINIETFNKGIYFFEFILENEIIVKKVVKQ